MAGSDYRRMSDAGGKSERQPRRRRIGFQLAETMAAVSQMALLCPCDMAAWMRREIAEVDRDRSRTERR